MLVARIPESMNINISNYFQIFKSVSFWLHNFCGYWVVWDPVNRFKVACTSGSIFEKIMKNPLQKYYDQIDQRHK